MYFKASMPMAGPIVLVMPALQYVHHGAPPEPPLDQSLITAHNQTKILQLHLFFWYRNKQGRIFQMLTYVRPNQADYILSQIQKCKMLESLPIFTKFLRRPN